MYWDSSYDTDLNDSKLMVLTYYSSTMFFVGFRCTQPNLLLKNSRVLIFCTINLSRLSNGMLG